MVKLEVICTFFFSFFFFYNLKRPVMTRYYFYNQPQLYIKQIIMVVKHGGWGNPRATSLLVPCHHKVHPPVNILKKRENTYYKRVRHTVPCVRFYSA